MKRILFVLVAFFTVSLFAQQDTLRYRITLTDKRPTTYSLERPQEFLSEKAIARRLKQQLSIDSTDIPVCREYVEAIRKTGVKVVATGKWENFITVSCNDTTLIDDIAAFPFVRETQKVWKQSLERLEKKKANKRDSITNQIAELEGWYGAAYQQIEMNKGEKLHEAGFKGEGMTIAVVDAGFHNADRIGGLDNVKVLGVRDFVNPDGDLFAENDHGLKVFSCMAMNKPHIMVGTAPEASYWLLRSEDDYSEYPVEQDYWAAAVEFADSVGVDVINTSLGYSKFDDKSMNYNYRNLDGRFAMMSRQASRLADKGIILVCSAGNEGAGSWKKITPPGDADNVLTVGAIAKNTQLAPFSSIGNTADNRIKPDVVAVGMFADVMNTNGELTMANGTSFATPILCGMVTCLWQALPHLTAKQLIELVRASGDRANHPDNIYGYGAPDVWKAYQIGKEIK
ncbi:S8 family serine peptidase [Bacteroides sp. OttesenSCG-928-J23]|nr:S8 family serine peptidase [Bacteroides sp. OttesenSCG-928-J23]